MAQSNFPLAVLQHTPLWVWALLAVLIATGVRLSLPRTLTLRRALLLPAAMLMLSLWSVATVFGGGTALVAWLAGVLTAAAWSLGQAPPKGLRRSADGTRFHLPASWMPLALMLAIFCTRFGVGVSLALHPEWQAVDAMALAAGFAYGALSGLFASRALVLTRFARRELQLA